MIYFNYTFSKILAECDLYLLGVANFFSILCALSILMWLSNYIILLKEQYYFY